MCITLKAKNVEIASLSLFKKVYLPTPLAVLLTACGIILTLIGAHMVVNNVILIATLWGVSETMIGLTIIAFGTSLPELVTSIIASIKKQSDLAIGNVIGSNIYNALFILGFTSLFLPVAVPPSVEPDVVVMTIATLVLLALGWWREKLGKVTGLIFVLAYFGYIFYVGTH